MSKARNIADPEKMKESESKIERKDSQRLRDRKALLSIPEGRRVLWEILADCQILGLAFNTNSLIMAATIGQQDLGKKILSVLEEADENALVILKTEARKEEMNG